MAVLKRGDKPNVLNLDGARKFAESFGIAWNIISTKSGEIFSRHWLLLVICLHKHNVLA